MVWKFPHCGLAFAGRVIARIHSEVVLKSVFFEGPAPSGPVCPVRDAAHPTERAPLKAFMATLR